MKKLQERVPLVLVGNWELLSFSVAENYSEKQKGRINGKFVAVNPGAKVFRAQGNSPVV